MDKSAFITGASGGLGSAAARLFAKEGYSLYLAGYKHGQALDSLAGELANNYGISCKCFIGDIGDYSFVESMFSSISSLDVLINNAGIDYIGLLSEMSPAAWDAVLRTNLTSVFYMSKAAIPLMLSEKSGHIINISSVWGNVGASMEAAYSASKGGLNALTKALAKELAPSNIQVNAIACGFMDTEMNACFSKEETAVILDDIPTGRAGTPEEAAKLTLQLAEAPAYLTGQIITLDGGWT